LTVAVKEFAEFIQLDLVGMADVDSKLGFCTGQAGGVRRFQELHRNRFKLVQFQVV
jgi:hypothetical protein